MRSRVVEAIDKNYGSLSQSKFLVIDSEELDIKL